MLAQFTFNLTAYQTMMKFQKLTDELSQQKGKQGEPKKTRLGARAINKPANRRGLSVTAQPAVWNNTLISSIIFSKF